jgi:zinc transport system substrate-binding protein
MKHLLLLLLSLISSVSFAKIITTVKPLTLIAQEVTRGIEQPVQLLPVGASAHHYSLKPSQRLLLQQADLVIWVGTSYESFLTSVLATKSHTIRFDSVNNIHKLAWRNLNTHQAQANTIDGHLWLDPQNAIQLAYQIAQVRGQQRPQYAAQYQKNAQIFAQKTKLQTQLLKQQFATLNRRDYVAYHDAYQYLEAPLGSTIKAVLVLALSKNPVPNTYYNSNNKCNNRDGNVC